MTLSHDVFSHIWSGCCSCMHGTERTGVCDLQTRVYFRDMFVNADVVFHWMLSGTVEEVVGGTISEI